MLTYEGLPTRNGNINKMGYKTVQNPSNDYFKTKDSKRKHIKSIRFVEDNDQPGRMTSREIIIENEDGEEEGSQSNIPLDYYDDGSRRNTIYEDSFNDGIK